MKNILISGSLVYDRIMSYPGCFKNHIIPNKIHKLNVTFHANNINEYFGGTAGNIAYNLSLLNEKPTILSTVGEDYAPYKNWLVKNKVNISQIKKIKNINTALFHVITDRVGNQIGSYIDGALAISRGRFSERLLNNCIAIISRATSRICLIMPDYIRGKE